MEATSIFYIVCGVYSGCPIFVATTEKVNLTEYSCLTVIFSALTGFCIYCCHTHIQAKRRIETVSKTEMKECTLAAKCTKICQSETETEVILETPVVGAQPLRQKYCVYLCVFINS